MFDVWAVEGSKKVDVAEFVEAYRSRADLDLYEAEFDHAVNVIRNNIYFLMGKQQNFERVRGLFAGDDADASALDLAAFTSRIQEFIPEEIHPMLQITIECVFNAFATDRLGTVKLDRFVRYLLKEKKKKVRLPHAHWEAYGRGSLPPHNPVSDSANPHYVSDPLPQSFVGSS